MILVNLCGGPGDDINNLLIQVGIFYQFKLK